MDSNLVTTGNELTGYKIVKYFGLVRGITVRSRNLIANIGAGFQTLLGGNITIYTQLCEKAREEAYDLMMEHATTMGDNAIIGMRYDANDVMNGVTEVLAYGTAVLVEKAP